MKVERYFAEMINRCAVRAVDVDVAGEAVVVPEHWSDNAARIVASRYFRGHVGEEEREKTIHAMINRVIWEIAPEGHLFLREELRALLLDQRFSFNSPVWFNVGHKENPQCSACYILSVDDSMESILDWHREESMVFKGGSGAGVNVSKLRAENAPLSGGGSSSGPVSFIRSADRQAGAMRSGGGTRRAAKMVIMDADHPDVLEFVATKPNAEKVAQVLIAAGYDPGFDVKGGAYDLVDFQNANHSVRFLNKPEEGPILDAMAQAAWVCGDPGIQYGDHINAWHTCPNSGDIEASNPCAEFLFLNDTSCNLASVNLLKFYEDGEFNADDFVRCVELMTIAMDVLVDMSSYPTETIMKRTKATRPLGVGYTNLGALLMAMGLPYDSHRGRDIAAGITSLMTATVYKTSALLAKELGPFDLYEENKEKMLRVVVKHDGFEDRRRTNCFLEYKCLEMWGEAYRLGCEYGFRNAQATVLAPTGTISFMMDCATTGIEPFYAPEIVKDLVGGGTIEQSHDIADPTSLVYQCAMPTEHLPALSAEAHLLMMAAVQPFLSGGISKTINLPNSATVEDIKNVYVRGYELGLKCIAVYRDGSKGSQPLSVKKPEGEIVNDFEQIIKDTRGKEQEAILGHHLARAKFTFKETPAVATLPRRRMPTTRRSITHKFNVAQQEGYLTIGLYDDDTPGEIFLRMSKEGSTLSGFADAWATAVSMLLQYGAPLEDVIKKFKHTRYEPSGMTENPDIRFTTSITDYVVKVLEKECGDKEEVPDYNKNPGFATVYKEAVDGVCPDCGTVLRKTGTCDACPHCGYSGGCG